MKEKKPRAVDAPIASPDQDLLGAHPYARQLAEHIRRNPQNVTVGIYGRWGSGKTSFVQLLEQELGGDARFIRFEAWPYRTSDELWRAMILEIARALYEVAAPVYRRKQTGPIPFSHRLRKFLRRRPFRRSDGRSLNPFASYKSFVAELDANLTASIRKSSPSSLADDDEAMLGIVRNVAAAAATISPFGEMLRALLGGEPAKQPDQLEAAGASRRRTEAIINLRQLLQRLFKEKALDERVCVFVDDLDRCLPDVALDLLEAIQVFLLVTDVKCVFIVAADEELIGQGLKARFKDLVESATSDQDRDFYARKGREYFEKIIQFGVPVPEAGPNEAYRLIGAHFPQWIASADLVIAALRTNPRRLKQYVGLLDYRYNVAMSIPDGVRPSPPRAGIPDGLREKLVALWWHDRTSAELLRAIAGAPELMAALQLATGDGESSQLTSREARDFVERVRQNETVLALLRRPPEITDKERPALDTILRFADLKPGTENLPATSDPVFTRMAIPAMRNVPIDEERLFAEDVTRLEGLEGGASVVVKALIAAAAGPDYTASVTSLEQLAGNSDRLGSDVQKYFTDSTVASDEIARRRALLTTEPLLSRIAPQVVLAYAQQTDGTAAKPSADAQAVLRVRIDAAEAYAARRRFAKIDVLIHAWPELGSYLNFDRGRILALEKAARDDQFLDDWVGKFRTDDRLIPFLKLRPFFEELYPGEVKKATAVAHQPQVDAGAAATAASGAPAPAVPSAAEEGMAREPVGRDAVTPARDGDAVETPVDAFQFDRPVLDDDTLLIRLRPLPDGEREREHSVHAFSALGFDAEGPLGRPYTFELDERVPTWPSNYQPKDRELKDVGRYVFNTVFQGPLRDRVVRLLTSGLRLIVDLSYDRDLAASLPWEAITRSETFPATEGFLHVTRYLKPVGPATNPAPTAPWRIVAVIGSSQDTRLPRERETRSMFERVAALRPEAFRHDIVDAGIEQLRDTLAKGGTTIFHCFGHATSQELGSEAGFFIGSEGRDFVGAGRMGQLLQEGGGVAVALLVGANTGWVGHNGIRNSVAGKLATLGIPAVIGTVRQITAESALVFSQRFYASLIETGDVERAIADSRRALAREKLDWSAYTLFSSETMPERLPLQGGPQ